MRICVRYLQTATWQCCYIRTVTRSCHSCISELRIAVRARPFDSFTKVSEALPFQNRHPIRIHLNVNNPSVNPKGRRAIDLCKQRSSLPRFKYKKIITQDRRSCLMILCNKKEIPNVGGDEWTLSCMKCYILKLRR